MRAKILRQAGRIKKGAKVDVRSKTVTTSRARFMSDSFTSTVNTVGARPPQTARSELRSGNGSTPHLMPAARSCSQISSPSWSLRTCMSGPGTSSTGQL
jgi:hypothetical protein